MALEPAQVTNNHTLQAPVDTLRFGHGSDVGQGRKNNQDACTAFAATYAAAQGRMSFGLFVVADGMGGHMDGEKASSLCIRVVTDHVVEAAYLPLLTGQDEAPDLMETLNEGVLASNLAVTEQMPNGGTTVTAAIIYGGKIYITQVGDSRAYLVEGRHMKALTRDHSLVQRLVELEQLTPEQAAEHPHRNILYRAIGQSEHLELDNKIMPMPFGARLLLCSDGLWMVVPEAEMMDILAATPNSQAACEKLIAAANAYGGPDNITAVLVDLPDCPDIAEPGPTTDR
ncbi:MAG: serine/threonine-protein phosphatase [Anaerolineae bacterium]|nr:serine/threonine-protein phosphatase [Anaerolineae bacterium]